MEKKVKKISDIAALAGVSKATVSRALNDNPLISSKTRERIQAIARKHHFATHQAARNLSLKRSNTIGLILPVGNYAYDFMGDPFFVELLHGVMTAASEHGYDLLIGYPRKNVPNDIQRYIGSKRADGLILLGCGSYVQEIARLFGAQCPIIVWDAAEELTYCSVNSNNLAGGRLAAEHLYLVGRRRSAFLGGPETEPEVRLRYQGYAETLEKFGLCLEASQITHGDYSSRSGYLRMQKLLDQAPDLDGVFCCSDFLAIGAMEALREKGRNVPQEISVVGFDDISLSAYCSPPLTTIRQHLLKAGETLVRNLIQFLSDGTVTRTILPVELIVRKSSDPRQ